MATGGIFQLITNDGKQDRMLMATALLNQRIDDIKKARGPGEVPTLYDIERTHILFTNAHFKPFAAIGYEYNKVTPSSGNSTSLGSKVQFSIPQFGDFFCDMCLHVVLSQPTMTGLPADPSLQNLFRWCDYPGERLIENVSFDVNGNPLDSYDSVATNFHREFCVQPNKKLAWDRCVGQEQPQVGYLDQPNWVSSGVSASQIKYRTQVVDTSGLQTPTGAKTDDLEMFIPLLFWCNKDPRLAVPSVAIPYGQRFINFKLAAQSDLVAAYPRGYADGTAWDTAAAAGGTLSTVTIKTLELYVNNIFVNPEVHNIFIKRIGFSLIRVHKQQVSSVSTTGNSILMSQLKWPIETLFVGLRYTSYASGGANLDKWYKFSSVTDDKRSTLGWDVQKEKAVASYASPATTFATTAGVYASSVLATSSAVATGYSLVVTYTVDPTAPSANVVVGSVLTFVSAGVSYSFSVESIGYTALGLTVTYILSLQSQTAVPATLTTVTGLTDFKTSTLQSTPLSYSVPVQTSLLSSVSIKAHGIPIYNDFPAAFYNAYLPHTYGGANIVAPSDPGALMINFCLYPGTYQPSGHINVSRAREFYIDFTAAAGVDTTKTANLLVVASAINFLLISDGSAVLRYST